MNEYERFGPFENRSSHVFKEEEKEVLMNMVREAKFKGKVTIYPENETEEISPSAGGSYDMVEDNIKMRMDGEGKETYEHFYFGEVPTFDDFASKFAHELGHSMANDNYKMFEVLMNATEDLFLKDHMDIEKYKYEYGKAVMDSEIKAWENGRTLIQDKEMLNFYDKTNELSFHSYSRGEYEAEDGTKIKGYARKKAHDALERRYRNVKTTKILNEEKGIDLKQNDFYKLEKAYRNIQDDFYESRRVSFGKEEVKDRRFPVFLDVDIKDQSTVAYLKTVVNEKIAAVYHPYDRLPGYMKEERRREAYEKGLHVLIPKEEDNKILHSLKNMKEKVRERTVVVTEKLSDTFTEKVRDTGVKVVESLEKLPKLINAMAEKFASKNLQKAVETQDVGEAKEYLTMGAVPDKETKLAIVTSKNLKSELLSFLKPKEKTKSKETDLEL